MENRFNTNSLTTLDGAGELLRGKRVKYKLKELRTLKKRLNWRRTCVFEKEASRTELASAAAT